MTSSPRDLPRTLPLLLTRKAAAAYVGVSEVYFDQLIVPRGVPIMVGRDARWTVVELVRVVEVLQEEARQRRDALQEEARQRREARANRPRPNGARSPSSKGGRGANPTSPEPSPTTWPPNSRRGWPRVIYLMPTDS